jgi:hypothetical protein
MSTATVMPSRAKKAPSRQVPWFTDVEAARRTALMDGRPCALILNADSWAL